MESGLEELVPFPEVVSRPRPMDIRFGLGDMEELELGMLPDEGPAFGPLLSSALWMK